MSVRHLLLAALAVPGLAHATTTAPDGYGYTITDEGTFAWEDLTSSGAPVFYWGDDSELEIALPFSFPWYGASYDYVTLSGNGGLAFTQGTGTVEVGYNSTVFPNLDTNAIRDAPDIAIFWDDLDLDSSGDVYAATLASGCFAIAFVDAGYHSTVVTGTTSFEAILCEDGSVALQYLGNTLDNGHEDGAGATAGIEDRAGGTALAGNAVVWSIHQPVLTAGVRLDVTVGPCAAFGGDTDGDGVCGVDDVCSGDDVTGDTDGDGVCDDVDLCEGDDAVGDNDGDGVCDDVDACDGNDALGDTDGDGVCNDQDDCFGDDATLDSDGDGICNDRDLCIGDDSTADWDGDGLCNDVDLCLGDNATGDSDGDGVCDSQDVCLGHDGSGDADSDGLCNDRDVVVSRGLPQVGQPWTMQADVAAGTRVFFFLSRTGPGTGPCRGSVCIGLDHPYYIGSAVADDQGRARLTVNVPASVPSGTTLTVQAAAMLDGVPQTSNLAASIAR